MSVLCKNLFSYVFYDMRVYKTDRSNYCIFREPESQIKWIHQELNRIFTKIDAFFDKFLKLDYLQKRNGKIPQNPSLYVKIDYYLTTMESLG